MGPRVLLIDDSELIRDFFARYLPGEGVECVVAATAEAGMELFRTWRPSVVLLDVGLPDRSGLEVLTEMLEDADCPPVIVWSAWPDAVTAAARSGATATVQKPFRPEDVMDAIARACPSD